jgi:hypothetical protein
MLYYIDIAIAMSILDVDRTFQHSLLLREYQTILLVIDREFLTKYYQQNFPKVIITEYYTNISDRILLKKYSYCNNDRILHQISVILMEYYINF